MRFDGLALVISAERTTAHGYWRHGDAPPGTTHLAGHQSAIAGKIRKRVNENGANIRVYGH